MKFYIFVILALVVTWHVISESPAGMIFEKQWRAVLEERKRKYPNYPLKTPKFYSKRLPAHYKAAGKCYLANNILLHRFVEP